MLAPLIAGFASGETMVALRNAKRAAVVYLFAAIAAACGVGFLVAAAYIWTAAWLGSIQAAVGFGVFFILVALLIVLAHRFRARSRARILAQKRASDVKALGIATAVAALPSLLKGKAGIGMLAVPVLALGAYAFYLRSRKADPDLPPE